MLTISAKQGRRLILGMQELAAPRRRRVSVSGLSKLVRKLGYVQIDSIRTVERAHHMILFSRVEEYRPGLLDEAVEHRRMLFENWTHDASVIPVQFFPVWRRRFERDRKPLARRLARWQGGKFRKEISRVLEYLEENGEVTARDLEEAPRKKQDTWWDWRPSKTALEFLWRTGDVAVSRRSGFQKVYDLTSRVVPDAYRTEPIDEREYLDWACSEALSRLGFGTTREIADYWGLISVREAKAWCERELGRGVVEVELRGVGGQSSRTLWAAPDLEARLGRARSCAPGLRILNPFDPVLRNRDRLQRLFGFDYRIEIYVPEEKRQFGYYVFPILERDRFIGRIDMKANRARGELRVKAIWMEDGCELDAGRRVSLDRELERYRGLTEVERVRFSRGFLKRSR